MTTDAEKIVIMQASIAGREIEYISTSSGDTWYLCIAPNWNWANWNYRIAPPRVDDIPWDALNPELIWAARDQNGELYLYSSKPSQGNDSWELKDAIICRVDEDLVVYKVNGLPWNESLQKRPA